MTRKEALRQTRQADTLCALGFTRSEALRRISLTLHRWHEHECDGVIQRDGDDGEGRPFWPSAYDGRRIGPAPDRERGALKRLVAIVERRNSEPADRVPLTYYVQTDPRGAALYILRPGDAPEGKSAEFYYSRGICVY